MRRFAMAAVLLTTAALSGAAQAAPDKQTLADIQADLNRVKAEVLSLKQELQPTGTSAMKVPQGSSIPTQISEIEAALQQLTNQTELLQNRIDRVVSDGTNRIGDLQYRLTELEGGDTSKLGVPAPLGTQPGKTGSAAASGSAAAPTSPTGSAQSTNAGAAPTAGTSGAGAAAAGSAAATAPSAPTQELAIGEQGDFDKAKAAFDAGNFKVAADLFASFAQTYTGGQLTGEALFMRGEALSRLGDTANAARAYLDSFSSYPKGPKAPDALTKLGVSLGKLGQTQDACTTLGQVSVRYPSSGAVVDAAQAMQSLGCK